MASDSLLLGPPQINTKSTTTAAIESSVETLNLSTQEPTLGFTGNPCLDFFFHVVPSTPSYETLNLSTQEPTEVVRVQLRDNLADPVNLVRRQKVEDFVRRQEMEDFLRRLEMDDLVRRLKMDDLVRRRWKEGKRRLFERRWNIWTEEAALQGFLIVVVSGSQPQNTKVYRSRWTGERDQDCDPSNRIIDIITQGQVVIIVAYDDQGGSSGPMNVAKGLPKKKTHKGAKGGRVRERSISGGRDGKAILDINRDPDPTPHIQGFPFSQANGGVEGRDESWYGLEREKGSGGRDGGSMGGGQEEEAVPDIKRDCHPTLHIGTNRRPEEANGSVERRGESPDELKWESGSESTCGGQDQERGESGGSEFRDEEGEGSGSVESRGRGGEGSGFGSECRDVKGEGSGSVESECRDAEEGEGSRSGANQARDGEGEGSSSGESQGQDRGEGSASGENQGGDGNAEGSGSNDDEDEPERQGSVGGDIEQGTPENNLNWRIDFSGIPQAFLAIIGATSIAAVEFHNRGAISSTALGRLIAIGVVGFLCCMASMLERDRKSLAAQIVGTIAVAAGSLEFLLLVSDNFSSYYGWMILGLGSLAIFLIFVRAYWCLFVRLFVWAYRR